MAPEYAAIPGTAARRSVIVTVKVFEKRLLVALLFYEENRSDDNGARKRIDILCSFPQALSLKMPLLQPKFFFTDKHLGKISAIEKA